MMKTETISTGVPERAARPKWQEVIRELELECARTFEESAQYWRREAARHLVNGNTVMAAECLLNAVVRESFAHEHLENTWAFGTCAKPVAFAE